MRAVVVKHIQPVRRGVPGNLLGKWAANGSAQPLAREGGSVDGPTTGLNVAPRCQEMLKSSIHGDRARFPHGERPSSERSSPFPTTLRDWIFER